MTLLVILGIVVLGIGCLLADWRPDDHDEMAPWRGFKNGGERRTGSRTLPGAEPEASHADPAGRLASHRVPNAERDRQRGQEHGKPKSQEHVGDCNRCTVTDVLLLRPTVTTSPRSAHFAMRSVQFAGAGEAKSAHF